MANKKISQFEQELILDGSEVLPIVKEGITKKVSIAQIVDKVDSYTKSEADTLLGGKVSTLDVKDNLTSEDTDKPLSANQGKVLQDGKANKNNPQFDGDVELTTEDKGIIFKSIGGTRYRLTVDDLGNLETEAL